MITKINKPYKISEKDIDKNFDGQWVLLHYENLEPTDGYGYIIAYGGSGENEQDDDWYELNLLSARAFKGDAQLIRGYKNRGAEMLHIL